MKEKLISKEMMRGIHPIFRGKYGDTIVKTLFHISGINGLNAIYDASKHLAGLEFVTDVLDKLGIKRVVENAEVIEQFKDQPFITVSNHPYGHIDGIIMASVMGGLRSDFKMMVNWLLMQIDTMEEFFIGVNPFPKHNKMSQVHSSVGGIKQCLAHIEEGHPLGLFPAGGVSRPSLNRKVKDREWQTSTMKLIKNANVPVVPVYISGSNSLFYQILGHIGWRVRSTWLLHEFNNKRGKTIYIRFGTPISAEQIQSFGSIEEMERYLYNQTYALRKDKE